MTLSVLYRGPLSSCNYDCHYCPFAKHKDSRTTLATDAKQLGRFVQFVEHQHDISFKILFTPWGEGLIRKYYQEALTTLSHFDNVEKVAIQTNLSCPLAWLKHSNKHKIALWTTYHPTQITRDGFVKKCLQLTNMGITYSVGIVGMKENLDEITAMREMLPQDTYLWVNAFKGLPDYYDANDVERIMAIDPAFFYNLHRHESMGRQCRTGQTVISVDGDGNMYRCHFVKQKLGNIYEGDFREALMPRTCTNATCGCHIGYVHMNDLELYDLFNGRELERVIDRSRMG